MADTSLLSGAAGSGDTGSTGGPDQSATGQQASLLGNAGKGSDGGSQVAKGQDTQGAKGGSDAGDKGSAQGDQKTATDGKGGQDDQQGKTDGVPEKYEFKMPEGMDVDQASLDAFMSIAKELELSQEKAQKLVDFYAGIRKAEAEAIKGAAAEQEAKLAESYTEMVNEWRKQAIDELGADYQKKLAPAARARDQFADQELKDLLETTGLANHPAVIRLFIKIGSAIAEDVPGSNGGEKKGAAQKSLSEVLFPDMK